MTIISKMFVMLLLLVVSSSAVSGRALGTVELVQVGHGYTPDNVYVLVDIDGERTARPDCANDDRMALNPSSEAGKAMYSLLLSARLAGQVVEVIGTKDCELMGPGWESVSYMRLK